MAVYDPHPLLAISSVATAPSPATSGTSLVVASGEGARFGSAFSFNATVCPAGQTPTPANSEIVRVSARPGSADTLTIARAQEGSSARSIVAGDLIFASVTPKVLTDLETNAPAGTVTSLPGSPVDGQEIYYLADATNGVVWHLKYRAASGSSYKWEFVGGGALGAEVDTDESRALTTYGALTTGGPSVTVPLAGDYVIEHGAAIYCNVTGTGYYSYDVGGTGAVDADAVLHLPTGNFGTISAARSRLKTGLAASTALVGKYRSSNTAVTAHFLSRWMRVRPVRVG